MTETNTLTIDGKEYALASLSDEAKAQLINLRACDTKLSALQQDMAIYQTARNAYAQSLSRELPEKHAHPNKKKDVIVIDGNKYGLDQLSEQAQTEIASLRVVDSKVAMVQQEVAMLQTARSAYAQALKAQLPE